MDKKYLILLYKYWGGDIRDHVPRSKYWGDVSPLSHRDRRPWPLEPHSLPHINRFSQFFYRVYSTGRFATQQSVEIKSHRT